MVRFWFQYSIFRSIARTYWTILKILKRLGKKRHFASVCPSICPPVGVRKLKFGTNENYMIELYEGVQRFFEIPFFWVKNGNFTNQKYTFLVKSPSRAIFRNL